MKGCKGNCSLWPGVPCNRTRYLRDLGYFTISFCFVSLKITTWTFPAQWTACKCSPCENGATCVDVNVDTFICVCSDGFFGVRCSNSKCCDVSQRSNVHLPVHLSTGLACLWYLNISAYSDTIFLATVEGSISPVPDPIPFTEVRLNPGGHYNSTTSTYTTPVPGTYKVCCASQGATRQRFRSISSLQWHRNGAFKNWRERRESVDRFFCFDSGHFRPTVLGSAPYLRNHARHARDGELNSWFSGRLISAD